MKNKGITVKGHEGTWYVIDKAMVDGKVRYLLESEDFGDEAASIIVDPMGSLILEDVCNGFDDLADTIDHEVTIKYLEYDAQEDEVYNREFKKEIEALDKLKLW